MKKKNLLVFSLTFISLGLFTSCNKPVSICEHDYKEKVIIPVTCVQDGESIFTCSKCNDSYTVEMKALGHKYGTLIPQSEGDCMTPGYKAHYQCEACELYFTADKVQTTLDALSLGKKPHDYHLTKDGMHYECITCHDSFISGKEEIGMSERKNYIFLGSSITNGYDSTTPETCSMADMFKDDYIQISYKFHNKSTFVNRDDIYMRKVEEVNNNKDGVGGKYQWYDEKVILDGNGNGTFEAYNNSILLVTSTFKYELKGSYIYIKEASGYVFDLFGHFYKGNKVYKHAENGYTLSRHEKYTAEGVLINPVTNYCCLLEQSIAQHKNEKIDTLIFQLSTNDVGSYMSKEGTKSGHIPFGVITDDNVKDVNAFDQNTSFGALEWIIAKSIEVWNCKVIVFTCHMSTGEYATYKANGYDLSKVVTPYAEMYQATLKAAEKWGIGLIDMFANKQVNIDIHEDAFRCLADSLHLHKLGYEKVVYPLFRAYCDKEGY